MEVYLWKIIEFLCVELYDLLKQIRALEDSQITTKITQDNSVTSRVKHIYLQ